MKYILIALLMIFNSMSSSAQEHSLYADIGTPPGFSVTYNYKLAKHWGTGIGIHGYPFYRPGISGQKFTPGISADIRLNIRPDKKNQFFSFLDLGIDIYKQRKKYFIDETKVYHITHNNGFYTGLGLGYLRQMTTRGGGPYASLKTVCNWFTAPEYSIVSEGQDKVIAHAYGNIIFSLGFKF